MARPTLDRRTAAAPDVRWLPAPQPRIHPATDLGGVAVLKHGNLYLLTDAFGDIHPDGRGLGLYDLDTRILSCAVLRLNGIRPTLLRSQVAANFEGTIQLTNPEYRRNREDKESASVERRSLSILRRRWISSGFAEHITVTNFSPDAERVAIDLELDCDFADIFEVRGYARDGRGEFLETAATDRSLVFGYRGRDGFCRRSYLAFSPGEVTPRGELPDEDLGRGEGGEGSVRVRWTATIPPGGSHQVDWRLWSDLRDGVTGARIPEPGHADRPDEIDREAVAGDEIETDRLIGARHPVHSMTPEATPITAPEQAENEYRTWTERTARVDSDGELLDLAIHRSVADLRLLMNDGPKPGLHYVAARRMSQSGVESIEP